MYKIFPDKKPVLNKDLMFVRMVKVDNFLEIERLYKDAVIKTIFPPVFNNYVLVFSEDNNSVMNGFVLWLEGEVAKAKLIRPSKLDKKTLNIVAKNGLGLLFNAPHVSIDLNPLEEDEEGQC